MDEEHRIQGAGSGGSGKPSNYDDLLYGVPVTSDLHGDSEITVSLNKVMEEEQHKSHLAADRYRHISVESTGTVQVSAMETPWLAFVSNISGITLLVASWTNVSQDMLNLFCCCVFHAVDGFIGRIVLTTFFVV